MVLLPHLRFSVLPQKEPSEQGTMVPGLLGQRRSRKQRRWRAKKSVYNGFGGKIMKHEDDVRESSHRENTHKEQAKERWEENADESLRGRESKMKQEGVSANFHNVTPMKTFMITDRDSQKCSLAGSLHTQILISLNTFPALVEVGTFFASAACSKSGLSLCITKLHGAVSPRSALEELPRELQVHTTSRERGSPALKLIFRRSRVRSMLYPAKAMETLLVWFLVGLEHGLVLIQS